MNIDITRGQILQIQWDLPIEIAPAPIINLNVSGYELSFFKNEERIAIFTSIGDNEIAIHYINDKWILHFATSDTSFLPQGTSQYEVFIYTDDHSIMMQDAGTVCVHE